MLSCPGFRSNTIVGIRTEKSKTSPICTALFRSCALVVCCFTPKSGSAAWFARASRDRRGPCVAGFSNRSGAPESVTLSLDGQGVGEFVMKPSPTGSSTPTNTTATFPAIGLALRVRDYGAVLQQRSTKPIPTFLQSKNRPTAPRHRWASTHRPTAACCSCRSSPIQQNAGDRSSVLSPDRPPTADSPSGCRGRSHSLLHRFRRPL